MRRRPTIIIPLLTALVTASDDPLTPIDEGVIQADYGVDVSWPMFYKNDFANATLNPLGGEVNSLYEYTMEGCEEFFREANSPGICAHSERERIAMNLRQPQSMQNYTDIGFRKIRAPKEVHDLLLEFMNTHWDKKRDESFPPGSSYNNIWHSPSTIISIDEHQLDGASIRKRVSDPVQKIVEQWTGMKLNLASCYGVRLYHRDAILGTHVDRNPLISSVIINVDQKVDEPWPLEVIGHDGRAYNITMEPGDMVLYESHSVLHGRPFPFKGEYYANAFIHFEPTGYDLDGVWNRLLAHPQIDDDDDEDQDDQDDEEYVDDDIEDDDDDEFESTHLPPYIVPGTPEAESWLKKKEQELGKKYTRKQNLAHEAAQEGDSYSILRIVSDKETFNLILEPDANGWYPLHEAARAGHTEIVEQLVYSGHSIVNKRTNDGAGGTPLWWAEQNLEPDHPTIVYLKSIGADSYGPEFQHEEAPYDLEQSERSSTSENDEAPEEEQSHHYEEL